MFLADEPSMFKHKRSRLETSASMKRGQDKQHESTPALCGIENESIHAQHLELPLLGDTGARPGDLPADSSTHSQIRNQVETGNSTLGRSELDLRRRRPASEKQGVRWAGQE